MANFTMDMSKERKPRELFQEGESVVKRVVSGRRKCSKNFINGVPNKQEW